MKRIALSMLLLLSIAAPMFASGGIRVSGRILGSDGQPIRKAGMHLMKPGSRDIITSVEADRDGKVSLTTDANGLIRLEVTGVDHQMYNLELFVDQTHPIDFTVRLAANKYPTSFESVKAIGDFNDFDFGTGKEMTLQKDGTYKIAIKTPLKKLRYQLLMSGPDGGSAHSVNGTSSTEYEYDGGGDYRSIITVQKGVATIIFEPTKLVRSDKAPSIAFAQSSDSVMQGIIEAFETYEVQAQRAMIKFSRGGGDMSDFRYDWTKEMSEIATRLRSETNPAVRQALMLEYVKFTDLGAASYDTLIAREALSSIPPTSTVWTIAPRVLTIAMNASGDETKYENYRWQVAQKHPDTTVRMKVLASTVADAFYHHDTTRLRKYYDELQTNFPESFDARYMKSSYGPDRAILIGKTIPHFAVASLDNAGEMLGSDQMKGKVYLIDFWATWCGPCVGEMEHLHQAYKKFHGRNFEIISLSFDSDVDAVKSFRKRKWDMPWKHAFVEGNFQSPLAAEFEVLGIPKPILVDAEGKIIASEDDLRGTSLDRTLTRVLGTNP